MKTTFENSRTDPYLVMFKAMKTLLATAFAFASAFTVQATDVKFTLGPPYFNASPASNRVVTLQALTPFRGNPVSYTSDVSGIFYASNLAVGDYAGVIRPKGNSGQIEFMITVTATDLGTVNAHEITSLGSVQTYPTSGRSSWTIQASDARYSPIGAGGLSFTPQFGTANLTNWAALSTNVLGTIGGGSLFLDSDSVTWSTVGGSNVAALTSNVTNDWRNYTLAASNSITAAMTNQNTGTSNGLFAHIVAATNGLGGSGVDSATVVAIMATNNAATATMATNLIQPGGFSEVIVAHPSNPLGVVSHDDFKFTSSGTESRLLVGTVGSTGSGGRITMHDILDQQDVDILVTNTSIFFPQGITFQDAVQSYSLVNGVRLPFWKGENHNSQENIGYFTGTAWDALAFQVGHSERAQATNGQRFSFLIGETDHSWNLIQFTNTTISRWTAGNAGPQQKNVISYNSANETYEFGTNVRSAILSGTNVTLSGQTNISFSGSDGVARLNTDGWSVGAAGKGGKIRLWDDIAGDWISLYAEDDVVIYDNAFAAPRGTFTTHITVSQTNVIGLNGSSINAVGITNGNVTIPGTLNVSGTTTAGTIAVGGSVIGNGSGITNLPVSALTTNGGTPGQVVTAQANGTVTWSNAPAGGSSVTFDTTQFGSAAGGTNIKSGALLTNVINRIDDETIFLKDSVGQSLMSCETDTSYINIHEGLSAVEFLGNGQLITNINAANISGDLVVETLTVATQYVTDAIIGNGSLMTNLNAENIVYYTNAIADMSVIDMTKPYAAISTNNNFVISGLSGLVAAGNQVQWATRFYTNTSGSTKTITVPAAWVDIGNNGTTIFNTNQGVLSVTRFPGFGTNFVWRGK